MSPNHIAKMIFVIGYACYGLPSGAQGQVTLLAHSTGVGQWVAYYAEPIKEEDLKPFMGRYLLAGKWPQGVIRPDDPKLLLDRAKLGATRVVAISVEAGGRLVRLTTDPVVSPEVHQLTIGKVTLAVAFWGLAVKVGAEDQGSRLVMPMMMDRKRLADYAAIDPSLKELQSSWIRPGQTLSMQGWLRLAAGEHKLKILSGREFTVDINGALTASGFVGGRHFATLDVESAGMEIDLKLEFPATMKVISGIDVLEVSKPARPGLAASSQVLLESNLSVPWTPEAAPEATLAVTPPPYELKGGNALKGRAVFYSEAAKCASCHSVGGEGGRIGPDLTGLRGADRSLVFQHINAPSDRIHPGYPSFSVALKGGQVSMGVVRLLDKTSLEIVDTDAKVLKVGVSDVEELRPSTSSVMPSGLAGTLGESAMRDLIEFLTVSPK